MIAEAIINSLLGYGVAVFLKPVYNEEDLNRKKLPKNTIVLQTLQESMIRVIYGLKCQKIGYGKTSLHINRLFYCCPLISL